MDVYILYFTLHGHDPNGLTSWSAIIVDEGEMDSFVGSGPSEFEALLDGLTNCLGQIPTTLPIVVRTRHRSVLQLGKRWLNTWHTDGWDSEVHCELISKLMEVLEPRRVEWFNPNYADQLDKTLVEYAIEEWTYQDAQLESIEPLNEASTTEVNLVEEVLPEINELHDTTHPSDIDDRGSVQNENEFEHSQIEADHLEDFEPRGGENTSKNDVLSPESSNLEGPNSDTSTESPTSESAMSGPVPSHKSTPEDIHSLVMSNDCTEQPEPSSIDPMSERPAQPAEQRDIPINPKDQELFPYVDDDGWRQLYTLFDAPFDDITERPSRIVAYVTACHNHDLAAWSFALIDKPSRMAFFKAVGHRHSTYNRAVLQGCIALLTTLKNAAHAVELRITDAKLASLLTQLIENPYATVENEHWMMDSAFVSQLSYWLEQRNLSVCQIDQHADDAALKIIQWCSTQRLTALNYGGTAEFSIRKPRFPLETLLN